MQDCIWNKFVVGKKYACPDHLIRYNTLDFTGSHSGKAGIAIKGKAIGSKTLKRKQHIFLLPLFLGLLLVSFLFGESRWPPRANIKGFPQ